VQSYYRSFKLPVIVTRGNNVYGPNQFDEKVIPRFIRQLKSDQKVTIQGDGSCVRSFLHASDAARAISIVLSKGVVGEVYNIGCDTTQTGLGATLDFTTEYPRAVEHRDRIVLHNPRQLVRGNLG
jgi:dTDP-D-glucose 4,6-dehydratase